MPLCQLELTGFYSKKEDGRRIQGVAWVSFIAPLTHAVNCGLEGASGETDVASGDHLVSGRQVLKGWRASQVS